MIRDHPRVCGEHYTPQLELLVPEGSSPRMRGTPSRHGESGTSPGIIPAYAGNTCAMPRGRLGTWDHPRVCGEHWARVPVGETCEGSSPRMRGTLHSQGQRREEPGIIPAYAGNTLNLLLECFAFRDHPRVCGEHIPANQTISLRTGSSPRMRGTHSDGVFMFFNSGIIPAYAGNTTA